jgi:hypothetical protein
MPRQGKDLNQSNERVRMLGMEKKKVIQAPEWAKKQMQPSQRPIDLNRARQQMRASADYRQKSTGNPHN